MLGLARGLGSTGSTLGSFLMSPFGSGNCFGCGTGLGSGAFGGGNGSGSSAFGDGIDVFGGATGQRESCRDFAGVADCCQPALEFHPSLLFWCRSAYGTHSSQSSIVQLFHVEWLCQLEL